MNVQGSKIFNFQEEIRRAQVRKVLKQLIIECKTQREFEVKCRRLFPVALVRINWELENALNSRFVEMVYHVDETLIWVEV